MGKVVKRKKILPTCGTCAKWRQWEHGEYSGQTFGMCCLPGVFTTSDYPCDQGDRVYLARQNDLK